MALSIGIAAKTSPSIWHEHLGHPSLKIINLIKAGLVSSFNPLPSNFFCSSCLCNKSHRLPFGDSNLSSRGPLDLIYTDVWGPSPVQSSDGFLYYVIFVDHFTKYVWLYPLRLKSDVSVVFFQFKAMVEKFLKRSIISIYSAGGGEYTALKYFFNNYRYSTLENTTSHSSTQWYF